MDLKRWKIFGKLDPIFAADIKRLYLIGISSRHDLIMDKKEVPWKGSIIVTRNDDVYTIVSQNSYSALSLLGVKVTKGSLPFVPVKMDALGGIEIQAISSGAHHVNALTSDGRIYQWGNLLSDNQFKSLNPVFVTGSLENQRVVQVACGQLHTLALTEEGEVYSWGNDAYGQLGIGGNAAETDPVKLSGSNGLERKVVSIACGGWTSYVLDIEGNVWSWGSNSVGALGRSSSAERQRIPLKISVRNVKKIAVGDSHVLGLTNDNTAYFWGQLCAGEVSSVILPKKIDVPNVVDIKASRGCTVSALKDADEKIYFWGFAYGQFTKKPVATKHSSFDELFNSLDPPMMLQPFELQLKQPVIVDKLRQRFDDNATGDVTFSVGGRLIHAHKMVLVLRSDHFNNFFTSNWNGRTRKRASSAASIEIADCTYSAFRSFLLYLYTDRIEPPPRTADELIELFKLAIKYEEEDLKRRCEQQLEVFITRNNVSKLYALAVRHDSKVLHDLAMDFIIPNYNAVVKTDEYLNMSIGLKDRLTLQLAAEDTFVGLKRKRKSE